MLTVSELSFAPRLLPVNFHVKQGEKIHLIGANGSGKTTLLSLLSGLIQGKGRIHLDGTCLNRLSSHQLACKRAYLSQAQKPTFSMSLYQYLSLSMYAHNADKLMPSTLIEQELMHICQQLDIADKLSRSTVELSGGEWQRVRLAGVWLQISTKLNPAARMLLLDEPATGLDLTQQKHLSQMIQSISAQGISIIMSSHDLNSSIHEADKLLLLKKGSCLGFDSPIKLLENKQLDAVFDVKLNPLQINGKIFIPPW